MATSAGFIKAHVLDVGTFQKTYEFPAKAKNVEIQNASACDVQISFDDDLRSEKYTLRPLQKTPVLEVQGGKTKIKFVSFVNGCKLELLMWG
jgi:hypothetical protein